MLPLVNCLEKGLAQPQTHERPVRVCGRAAASYPHAAPATDLILKPLRPKRLFFLSTSILSGSFCLHRTSLTVGILAVWFKFAEMFLKVGRGHIGISSSLYSACTPLQIRQTLFHLSRFISVPFVFVTNSQVALKLLFLFGCFGYSTPLRRHADDGHFKYPCKRINIW